jgi:hypothetical protein
MSSFDDVLRKLLQATSCRAMQILATGGKNCKFAGVSFVLIDGNRSKAVQLLALLTYNSYPGDRVLVPSIFLGVLCRTTGIHHAPDFQGTLQRPPRIFC